MKKDDLTSDPDKEVETDASPVDSEPRVEAEASSTDPEPLQNADSTDMARADSESTTDSETEVEPEPPPEPLIVEKKSRSWFGWFNFLLILALAGAAGYYWHLQQQVARDYEATIADLQAQIAQKASNDAVASGLEPLRSDLGQLDKRIGELKLEQKALVEASEKLYELYGRDKNDWQLAEVEYLMRVAQHKLILQDDFAGAAITLQAASDLIGQTGDPGLLPVRVMISEEIAELRTRKRADLVGMTLILAQLSREVLTLKPGFAPRTSETAETAEADTAATPASTDFLDQLSAYIESLIEIRHETSQPTETEANIADVGQTLADNLKLARWAVLERDAHQYQQLIDQSLRLFREFYDLDNVANHEFMSQLTDLQKRVLKPEKPDITGSMREMLRILSQRESAPESGTETGTEASNG